MKETSVNQFWPTTGLDAKIGADLHKFLSLKPIETEEWNVENMKNVCFGKELQRYYILNRGLANIIQKTLAFYFEAKQIRQIVFISQNEELFGLNFFMFYLLQSSFFGCCASLHDVTFSVLSSFPEQ